MTVPLWLPARRAGVEALVNLGLAAWVEALPAGRVRVHFSATHAVDLDEHIYTLGVLLAVRAEAAEA